MILITGSSGHLGANLVRRLLDDGHDVRVLLRKGSNNAAVDGRLQVDSPIGGPTVVRVELPIRSGGAS